MDQMIKQREYQNTMNLIIKHRNVDHEAAWKEIMKWESRHANKEGTDFKYHISLNNVRGH